MPWPNSDSTSTHPRFDLDRGLVAVSSFYLDRYLSMHYVDEEVRKISDTPTS